jgi:hypothetical protein
VDTCRETVSETLLAVPKGYWRHFWKCLKNTRDIPGNVKTSGETYGNAQIKVETVLHFPPCLQMFVYWMCEDSKSERKSFQPIRNKEPTWLTASHVSYIYKRHFLSVFSERLGFIKLN